MVQTDETATTPHGADVTGFDDAHQAMLEASVELVASHVAPTDAIGSYETQQQVGKVMSDSDIHVHVGPDSEGVEYLDKDRGYRKLEMRDDNGQDRPIYRINGRQIAMRTRWEFPSYVGCSTATVSYADPIKMIEPGTTIRDQDQWQRRQSDFEQSQTDPDSADILFVENTPEGIIEAVILLGESPDPELASLHADIRNGKYDERAIMLLDELIGCMSMDDNGNFRDYVDHDAFAIVIAALVGDESAQDVVNKRLSAYLRKHEELLDEERKKQAKWYEEKRRDIEAISPEQVCLVHSTPYGVEINDNGEIILYSSSQKRLDRYPRSTIHFTPNCQVTSHAYAPQDAWSDTNRLIVTNFADMIAANGPPRQTSDVDTFFDRNPGEALVLPAAVVIEPIRDQHDLITVKGNRVTYKMVSDEEYTEDDKKIIEEMMNRYPGDVDPAILDSLSARLRECVLRQVMWEKGTRTFITPGMHYGSNEKFQDSYNKLGYELGVTSALHMNTPEYRLEEDAVSTFEVDERGRKRNMFVPKGASIKAIRQVVASGYVPVSQRHISWQDEADFI